MFQHAQEAFTDAAAAVFPKAPKVSKLSAPLIPTTNLADKKDGTPLAGGVFVLANTILGAGMLGLPFAFAACGYLVGPVMLVAFATCSTTALVLLSEAADKAGRPANFRSVSEMALPGAGVYIDIAVAIKCFGVATSYLIVVGDSVPKAIVAFGASGVWIDRRTWTLVALACAGPLAFMKQITALRHVSVVALSCVMLIALMIVAFALGISPDLDPCSEAPPGECAGPMVPVTGPMEILRALPLFVFSYTCHQNIFSITNELARPTRSRNASVAMIAVGLALGVYMVLGFSGYYTFGSKVAKDILVSYPKSNVVVSAARLAISLVVTCCYPLQAHPSRVSFTSLVKKLAGEKAVLDEEVLHWTISSLFVCATGGIALVVSDLGLVLSVVGATGSTIVSYVLPGLSYYLLFPDRPTRFIGLALGIMGCIIMPISLFFIFYK